MTLPSPLRAALFFLLGLCSACGEGPAEPDAEGTPELTRPSDPGESGAQGVEAQVVETGADAEPAEDLGTPDSSGLAGTASFDDGHLAHTVAGGIEISAESRARVAEMIEVLIPLDQTLTSDYHDRHFVRQQKLVEELMHGDLEVGIAALRAYVEYRGEETLVRDGLLTVAAYAATDESRELLSHLVLDYGHPIDDRTYALTLLAETSPGIFRELAEPMVHRHEGLAHTMPPDEFWIRGWVTASEQLGLSPVEALADVVTNLRMEQYARHFAAEALGRYPGDPLGAKALEAVMVESSGNGYLRRKAAQALRVSIPREGACELFYHVFSHEADVDFRAFLGDMLEEHCRE